MEEAEPKMEVPVTEDRKAELRHKFLEQCKKYTGVPYKRKYHKPGSPAYNSKLFLDCCGLIRRVLQDLRKDFGFSVGPWNQAYMFDTLPKEVKCEEEMQPGDLVFISGIYINKKQRVQPHNMVHVEVWMGDGQKTIGARWHKGKVQVFDSYRFVSTSYHSMAYHFRSIDTWLGGVCKSFCPKHAWRRKKRFNPCRKSVFRHVQSTETSKCHSDSEQNQSASTIDASQEEDVVTSSALSNGNSLNASGSAELNTCQEELERPVSQQHVNHAEQKSAGDHVTSSPTAVKYISFTRSIGISDQQPDHLTPIKLTSQTPYTDFEAFANITSTSKFRKQNGYVFTNKPLTSKVLSSITVRNPIEHNAKDTGNLSLTNNLLGQHQNSPQYTSEIDTQNCEQASLDSIEQVLANLSTDNSELQIK